VAFFLDNIIGEENVYAYQVCFTFLRTVTHSRVENRPFYENLVRAQQDFVRLKFQTNQFQPQQFLSRL
jgi:hypothetical protein